MPGGSGWSGHDEGEAVTVGAVAGPASWARKSREAYPNHYARINAYDPTRGRRTIALQFMVNRPREEPGFALDRTETRDRRIHYGLCHYAAEKPHGCRYGSGEG